MEFTHDGIMYRATVDLIGVGRGNLRSGNALAVDDDCIGARIQIRHWHCRVPERRCQWERLARSADRVGHCVGWGCIAMTIASNAERERPKGCSLTCRDSPILSYTHERLRMQERAAMREHRQPQEQLGCARASWIFVPSRICVELVGVPSGLVRPNVPRIKEETASTVTLSRSRGL